MSYRQNFEITDRHDFLCIQPSPFSDQTKNTLHKFLQMNKLHIAKYYVHSFMLDNMTSLLSFHRWAGNFPFSLFGGKSIPRVCCLKTCSYDFHKFVSGDKTFWKCISRFFFMVCLKKISQSTYYFIYSILCMHFMCFFHFLYFSNVSFQEVKTKTWKKEALYKFACNQRQQEVKFAIQPLFLYCKLTIIYYLSSNTAIHG